MMSSRNANKPANSVPASNRIGMENIGNMINMNDSAKKSNSPLSLLNVKAFKPQWQEKESLLKLEAMKHGLLNNRFLQNGDFPLTEDAVLRHLLQHKPIFQSSEKSESASNREDTLKNCATGMQNDFGTVGATLSGTNDFQSLVHITKYEKEKQEKPQQMLITSQSPAPIIESSLSNNLNQLIDRNLSKKSMNCFKSPTSDGLQIPVDLPLGIDSLMKFTQLQSQFIQEQLQALGVSSPPMKCIEEDVKTSKPCSEIETIQSNLNKNNGHESFPMKLHRILRHLENIDGGTEIASFLPDGKLFIIKHTIRFEKEVMTRHFPRMKHFPSFQRQLNLYDFRRINELGRNRGAYCHHLFLRDHPDMASLMRRRKIKGITAKR